MPSRTYVGIDFLDYLEAFVFNVGTELATATPIGNFNTSINGQDTGTGLLPPGGAILTFGTYDCTGRLDFDVFPAIPDNAQITRVQVKIDGTIACNTSVTGVTVSVTENSYIETSADIGVMPDIRLEVVESELGVPGPADNIQTVFDHFTSEQDFDYSGAPITKTQLEADFTNWTVRLNVNPGATVAVGPGVSSYNTTVTLDGIQIIVTYNSGPEISVSPAGGNVEVGQTLQLTGPNLAENTYAAIIGDKIVPLELSNNFTLEIPYPPSDPCFDCFGDCPECDTCFAACDEDLTGEACQACIEACLECLTECLESLSLAEECQQSTGEEPTSEIPVIVICGGPGFSGTVALANFTILVSNGSGIYRFVLGKTNDTLYTAERDGTTYDVKIPNPGGKTGFFRS